MRFEFPKKKSKISKLRLQKLNFKASLATTWSRPTDYTEVPYLYRWYGGTSPNLSSTDLRTNQEHSNPDSTTQDLELHTSHFDFPLFTLFLDLRVNSRTGHLTNIPLLDEHPLRRGFFGDDCLGKSRSVCSNPNRC